jgi:hypothetical protein
MHKYEQKGSLKDGTSEQMSNGPPVKNEKKRKMSNCPVIVDANGFLIRTQNQPKLCQVTWVIKSDLKLASSLDHLR